MYVQAGGGRGGPGSFAERLAIAEAALVTAPEGSDGAGADELAESIRSAAGGDGVDVTLDPLCEPMVAAAKASASGARIVSIGQSAGPEATLASATVRGSTLSILGYPNFDVPAEVVPPTAGWSGTPRPAA